MNAFRESISGFAVARTNTPIDIAKSRSKVPWTRFVKINAWLGSDAGPVR